MRGVTRSTVLLVGLPLLGLGVAGTEVVPASVSPIAASVAAASTTRAAAKSTTYYAINKRICTTPKKTRTAACFAERRVLVKAGTKGARSFTPAAGATGTDTIGPAGGLTPSDLATAYALTTTGGSGQTVAIVDAYNNPNIAVDLATFDSQYGLAACPLGTCLTVVNQTGGTALPANDTQGWSVEESLDVDAVHSVCQACKIILVEANSPSNADLAIAENTAVQLGATEVSNSFGGFESDSDPTFQAAFDHPGTVITAAAGDDGYYNFDQLAAINQPDVPASYNTVVAVGGTSLYLGQNATRQAETVWNSNGTEDFYQQVFFGLPLGAGGGGCSTLFAARHWQTNLSGWASTACGTKRLVADIAAVGDSLTGFDVYDSYDCGAACGGGGAGLVDGRRDLAVHAHHRRDLRACRWCPRHAVPGADALRPSRPRVRRDRGRQRLVWRRGRGRLRQPELAGLRRGRLRLPRHGHDAQRRRPGVRRTGRLRRPDRAGHAERAHRVHEDGTDGHARRPDLGYPRNQQYMDRDHHRSVPRRRRHELHVELG